MYSTIMSGLRDGPWMAGALCCAGGRRETHRLVTFVACLQVPGISRCLAIAAEQRLATPGRRGPALPRRVRHVTAGTCHLYLPGRTRLEGDRRQMEARHPVGADLGCQAIQ